MQSVVIMRQKQKKKPNAKRLRQWFLTLISLPNPYAILHDFVVVNGDNYGLKRFF